MGFERSIRHKILLEWKNHYIAYNELKLFFKPFKTTAKLLLHYFQNSEKLNEIRNLSLEPEEKAQLKGFYFQFREIFSREIEKVNEFLQEQVRILEKEWSLMKSRALLLKTQGSREASAKEFNDLKVIFHLFYLKLGYITEFFKTNEHIIAHTQIKFNTILLIFQDFLSANSAISSINAPKNPMHCTRNELFNRLSKDSSATLYHLLQKARYFYLSVFYLEHQRNAGDAKLKELFRQTQSKLLSSKTFHTLYFFMGIGFVLLLMIILLIYNEGLDPDSDNQAQRMFKYQFPIFRGFLFIVLYLALLAFNVYGWLRNHLNYRGVFGLYKHYSSPAVILKRVLFFSSLWLLTFLVFLIYVTYYKKNNSLLFGFVPVYYLSGINWLLFCLYLFFPSRKIFNGKGRVYIFKLFWKTVFQSCLKVDFPMIFFINQFTSFVLALKDLEYTMCYYISVWLHPENEYPQICLKDSFQVGFVFAFLPLFIRIIQCIRIAYDRKDRKQKKLDIINIFKFVTSGIVTILSLIVGKLSSQHKESYLYIFYLWIGVAGISTVYSYLWDIKMGWGLCQKGYGLLRARLYYNKYVYYLAIVLNFLFRITWMLNISPAIINDVLWRPEFTAFLIGFCEMVRRTIWNFLRLDKEIAFSPQNYRLIPDIRVLLTETSPKNSLERENLAKNSEDFVRSTFSLEDLLMRKGYLGSLDNLLGVKHLDKGNAEEEKENSSVKRESEWNLEGLEDTKRKIQVFEKRIISKSRKNTFLVNEE